ncbi:hypothetical protein WBP06_01330 [Novosphingobium sp. BL-8H]|uniref:hypothetical protein n=1 Tax=Novosphingobium sp. BL-8H TaxID=3127640 RepID=UPI0037575C3D
MTRIRILFATTALASAAIGAGMAVPALAQETWSLQPGADATQAPRAPGPVDAQNPVVARPSSAPDDAPSPQVTLPAAPPPTVKAPSAPAPAKAPAPKAPPQAQAPAATAPAARPSAAPVQAAPRAVETPAATPSAAAPQPAPPAVPQPTTSQAPSPAVEPGTAPAASTPTTPAATASHWPEWWLAIPVALLLAALGVFALLRRRAAPATAWEEAGLEPEAEEEETPETVQPVAPPAAPTVAAPAVATVPMTPAAPATPLRAPVTPLPPKPLVSSIVSPRPAPVAVERAEVVFEPVLMRQSLVYATLVYRMTLTAPAEGLAEGAVIAADMISAHASLSQAEQLAPDPTSVPPRHRFEPLAPGETREVKGEIQLPLNAIRPVRQGNAMLFVPLLRLFLALPDGSIERRVFSLGLPGDGAGLAPVRIDTGPRDHAPIQAREIDGARSYSGPHVPQAAE